MHEVFYKMTRLFYGISVRHSDLTSTEEDCNSLDLRWYIHCNCKVSINKIRNICAGFGEIKLYLLKVTGFSRNMLKT
jgi:hypothetical protein